MLKRNLIVIAIVVLGLGITSAFGQDFDHNPRPKSVRKGTVKKPSKTRVDQTQTQRTRKPNTSGLTDLDANKQYLRQSSNAGSSSRTRRPASRSTNQKIVKKPANWSFGESQQVPIQQVRRVKKP